MVSNFKELKDQRGVFYYYNERCPYYILFFYYDKIIRSSPDLSKLRLLIHPQTQEFKTALILIFNLTADLWLYTYM